MGCYAPKLGSSNNLNRWESDHYRNQPKTYDPTEILQSEAELEVWGIKMKHKDAQGNYPRFPPTNSSPNTSESKEQAAHEKTDGNSSKKTQKSNELQTGNRRNHEGFHSLRGQILYKRRKNLTLESKEMRSSPDGWFAWKP
jgi:hypothetical protein